MGGVLPYGFLLRFHNRRRPGHLWFDAFVDLGVFVIILALVGDLAPVGREVEMPRVFSVVAPLAEPVLIGLLGFQSDRAS